MHEKKGLQMSRRKMITIATVLIIIIVVSCVAAVYLQTPKVEAVSDKPFYVGIATGWDINVSECETLIDKVKNYTNLFIIASPLILGDEALLNQTCDYAVNAGLNIMVNFNDLLYSNFYPKTAIHYTPTEWIEKAEQRYGDQFLGVYFMDEEAGSKLDENIVGYLDLDSINGSSGQPCSYQEVADEFLSQRSAIKNGVNQIQSYGVSALTSDYGLYWWDYQLGYDIVLAQLGWNNSRPLQIALTRGAANLHDKDWGVIVTWTYNQPPYLETGGELYDDLVLAYDSGATYAAIYDSNQGFQNTTLAEEHYEALKDFWTYKQTHEASSLPVDTALVLPEGYGFGFRNPNDSIWSLKQADDWTNKMYNDVHAVLNQYNSRVDIVYSDPDFQDNVQNKYDHVMFWPKDFQSNSNYPVIDITSGFGYDTIQEAISSYATNSGDTITVKPGTYKENLQITKSVTLISQNHDAIIDGAKTGSAVTITHNNVTLTGFTVQNGGNFTDGSGAGILLSNVHYCNLTDNVVTGGYGGILLQDSCFNVLSGNVMEDNKFNFGVYASTVDDYVNDVASSNTVDGKPVYYLVGEDKKVVPVDAGFVALVNCSEITVDGLQLRGNYEGLLVVGTQESTITNNSLTGNYEGILLDASEGNTLRGNSMTKNTYNLDVQNIEPNDIDVTNTVEDKPVCFLVNQQNQTVPSNAGYVALFNCTGITVQGLELSGNGQGVLLYDSSNCTVVGNVFNNLKNAVELNQAACVTVNGNSFASIHENSISLLSSNSNLISNNNVTESSKAISLIASSNNNITRNIICSNSFGLWLKNNTVSNTTGNLIFENKISENQNGIDIEIGAQNNMIYRNNFLNNTQQVYGFGMTYSGSSTSFVSLGVVIMNNYVPINEWSLNGYGNYWSDYTGLDENDDGIGDTAYVININNNDDYPLMQPTANP
jgi:parallel beta-helix repeat protein